MKESNSIRIGDYVLVTEHNDHDLMTLGLWALYLKFQFTKVYTVYVMEIQK